MQSMLRRLRPFALALLGLVPLASSSVAQTASTPGQPDCAFGLASGTFNLPAGQPGSLEGLLRGPGGTALFAVKAVTLPDPSTPEVDGVVQGTLFRLQGPGAPKPVAAVQGRWDLLPNGKGRYKVVFLQPDPANPGNPTLFGASKGIFLDPPQPGLVGLFQGKWAVCP